LNQLKRHYNAFFGAIDESIKIFELTPFLAIRSLRRLAEENSERYPVASRIALRDFYVDDLITGADTLQEAVKLKEEMAQLMREGKFELRKWSSNEPSLQHEQSVTGQGEFRVSDDKTSERHTLGIIWNCTSDTFKFSYLTCTSTLENPTKRSILSRIASIFDPLGLLGPVTLVAKTIMQDMWRLKLDWDESMPLDLNTKWKRYEGELQFLRNLTIPRLVTTTSHHIRLELHGFADASETAYGACIYFRATSANNKHSTYLLCSKSRVAPLKSLSLPRLELCAALLLAQLVDKVSKCLSCRIDSISLWTDSTIVLSWLQSCSRTWSTFVANRVGEIQQLTPAQYWNHIRSEYNPADPLSRGVMPNSLITLKPKIMVEGAVLVIVRQGSVATKVFTYSQRRYSRKKNAKNQNFRYIYNALSRARYLQSLLKVLKTHSNCDLYRTIRKQCTSTKEITREIAYNCSQPRM